MWAACPNLRPAKRRRLKCNTQERIKTQQSHCTISEVIHNQTKINFIGMKYSQIRVPSPLYLSPPWRQTAFQWCNTEVTEPTKPLTIVQNAPRLSVVVPLLTKRCHKRQPTALPSGAGARRRRRCRKQAPIPSSRGHTGAPDQHETQAHAHSWNTSEHLPARVRHGTTAAVLTALNFETTMLSTEKGRTKSRLALQ